MCESYRVSYFFFFNDTATTEIYTLSLHDALPISARLPPQTHNANTADLHPPRSSRADGSSQSISSVSIVRDRKSTRLNSSHQIISYAVFCLKKKKIILISKIKILQINHRCDTRTR